MLCLLSMCLGAATEKCLDLLPIKWSGYCDPLCLSLCLSLCTFTRSRLCWDLPPVKYFEIICISCSWLSRFILCIACLYICCDILFKWTTVTFQLVFLSVMKYRNTNRFICYTLSCWKIYLATYNWTCLERLLRWEAIICFKEHLVKMLCCSL